VGVAEDLAGYEGVLDAHAAPVTGSVLVRYEPQKIELPRLVALIIRIGGLHGLALDVPEDLDAKPTPGASVRRAAAAVDRRVRGATAGKMDLRAALPAALAGTGIAMLFAGRRRVPAWYDLLFWSFVTFVNLNPPETAATRDGA
jgi:hypothetical protein